MKLQFVYLIYVLNAYYVPDTVTGVSYTAVKKTDPCPHGTYTLVENSDLGWSYMYAYTYK